MRLPIATPRLQLFFSMVLFYAGITIRYGGLLFFGIGIAAVIFTIAPSKDIAGAMNAVFLQRLVILEAIGTVLYCIGIILFMAGKKNSLVSLIPLLLALATLGLLGWYGIVIMNEMEALREQISSFQNPLPTDTTALERFRILHKQYSSGVGIALALGMILSLWQTFVFGAHIRLSTETQEHRNN